MRLAVLESRWAKLGHCTVKPLFDVMSEIAGTRDAYVYERFIGKKSFDEVMRYTLSRSDVTRVYFACHGNEKGLWTESREVISWVEIQNDLERAAANAWFGKIEGLFFGTCLFGSASLGDKLLGNIAKLKWVAGYSKEVDWIESSALDLLFLNKLIASDGNTELEHVAYAARQVASDCSGLVEKLGFDVRARRKGGGFRSLVHP